MVTITKRTLWLLTNVLVNWFSGMDSEYAPVHNHCASCVKLRCNVDPTDPDNCDIVSCELDCGAKFHRCKQSDHVLLCPALKVPCINHCNGCPMMVCRSKLGVHLQRCPASVIVCPGEWNRWPVYSQERKARVPFTQQNLHAKYGQLDVALALRDQRMLNNAMTMPRRVRQSLRNNLTQRFPAVPLGERRSTSDMTAADLDQLELSDDDSDAPWETSKKPPGLQQSVCGELFKASKKAADSLTSTISLITDHFGSTSSETITLGEGSCDNQIGTVSSSCDKSGSTCDTVRAWHEMPVMSSGCSNERADMSLDDSVYDEDNQPESYVSGFATSTTNDAVVVLREQMDADQRLINHAKTYIPSPPRDGLSLTLQEILALDLNLESITKYHAKPKSMYTFLCAQMFRRDEYASHFRNVHCDIHAGLSGWMECRCPLAHYGCTYSVRRLYPTHKGAMVVYSEILESFGVKPYVSPSLIPDQMSTKDTAEHTNCAMINRQKEMTPEIVTSRNYDSAVQINGTLRRGSTCSPARDTLPDDKSDDVSMLTRLPFEVLRCVAQCLDSYSLSNLALTCLQLREVCCDLLEERGIVVLQWERKWLDGCDRWIVTGKVQYEMSKYPAVNKGCHDLKRDMPYMLIL